MGVVVRVGVVVGGQLLSRGSIMGTSIEVQLIEIHCVSFTYFDVVAFLTAYTSLY